MTAWYDNDDFWTVFGPILFDDKRLKETPEEVDRLLALVEGLTGMDVLDMPCGVGRHSLELARRGFTVTGVDRTKIYLDQARLRSGENNLEVEWVEDDMRRFQRPSSYDLALNLFTSLGYTENLEDDRKVIRNLHASLRPGGTLVIEMTAVEVVARTFCDREFRYLDDGAIWLEERSVQPLWRGIDNKWSLIKNGVTRQFEYSLRLFTAVELADLVESVGFTDVEVYGGMDGAPFDHEAERLVLLARK